LNNELIFNIKHISANYFLVGTQENLYVMEYSKDSNSLTEKIKVNTYPPSKVVDIIKIKEGKYFVLSRDKGIFQLSLNLSDLSSSLSESYSDSDGILDNIQGALIVKRNELWVNTMGRGIIKFQIGKESGRLLLSGYINSETGLKSNEVKCLFEDRKEIYGLACSEGDY